MIAQTRVMRPVSLPVFTALLLCAAVVAEARGHLSFQQVKDTPGLPRVLLIGDSISMQYTLQVRKLLDGRANVHRPARNCRSTRQTLAELDAYLGKGRWDLVHFNWGIHDLTHLTSSRKAAPPPEGRPQVPLEEYEQNVRTLVKRLKRTGARLIWASTTPIGQRAEVKGYRRDRDVVAYNAAAGRVMRSEGVATNDLYATVKPRAEELLKDGVHFNAKGAQLLARAVVEAVGKELGATPPR